MTQPGIQLQNEQFALEILPSVGGKISSLRSVESGYEWLWRNPQLSLREPVYGESYTEKIDFGGWDEIFPSVSPVTLTDGTQIPDHGDLVFLPAELLTQSDSSLTLRWVTRCYACEFTRTITLIEGEVELSYRLLSRSDKPLPYLWAAHPLVALEHGMTLELPSGDLDVLGSEDKLTDILPHEIGDEGHRFLIEDPVHGRTEPRAVKIFSQPGGIGWITLHRPVGGCLRMEWDSRENPYLGIWLNQRGWSGCGSEPYFNIGLEPTTSPFDDLNEAIEAGKQHVLQPGELRSWSLRVRVS